MSTEETEIPTAQEVLSNIPLYEDIDNSMELQIIDAMKEYGNNIREQALKEASEKAVLSTYQQSGDFKTINKDSILSAYGKENIK